MSVNLRMRSRHRLFPRLRSKMLGFGDTRCPLLFVLHKADSIAREKSPGAFTLASDSSCRKSPILYLSLHSWVASFQPAVRQSLAERTSAAYN